ncbi:MAG: S-layer homology domain-containing protein [Oscillospiraceae bacterium]|nr:S-layer homology domain-containing protein [Oscillospiraceae bacterium]
MKWTHRVTALFLCLLMLATCVTAAELAPQETGPASPEAAVTPQLPQETETPTEPIETEPIETEPAETEPAETEPVETEPVSTEPAPTEPEPTEPEPTEPPEPPVSQMTDEQIIAKFHIKKTWSRTALIFAVRNGLLVGKGNDDLAPRDNTTHAELATILGRILRTKQTGDLSRFTDLDSRRWYMRYMGQMVKLGLYPIADPNATALLPNVNVTREEVFVTLARMFGVRSNQRQALYNFDDWRDVSGWAAEELSAMVETKMVLGSTDNKLHPKDNITREELAQVLNRLIHRVGSSIYQNSYYGSFALAADTLEPNTTIQAGNLLLSNEVSDMTLEGLTVEGRLIIQGNGRINLHFVNCNIQELVLCREANVYSNTTLSKVTVLKPSKLYGNANTLNVWTKGTIVYGGVNTLNIYDNASMTVAAAASVAHLNVLGDSVYINGSGSVQNLVIRGADFSNQLSNVASTTENLFKTAASVTAVRTDGGKATSSAPTLTLGLKLSNMPEGWSECDLKWYVNGELLKSTTRELLKEGSTITASKNFSSFMDGTTSSVPVTVYLTIDGKQVQLYKGSVSLEETVAAQAAKIRTQDVQAKLNSGSELYTSMYLTTVKKSGLLAGTQVTVLQSRTLTEQKIAATQIRLADGTTGWVSYYKVNIINGDYYVTYDYPTAVKEYYVNTIRKCSSNTKYLIWVSLWTQRINIFQGSKGNWKLIQSGPIASGRNDCPTPAKVTTIWGKKERWVYTAYYCHHVSTFDEARGFHSRPTKYDKDGGGVYSYAMGYPASAGCVRLMDAECIFIYNNCPTGTAVVIY